MWITILHHKIGRDHEFALLIGALMNMTLRERSTSDLLKPLLLARRDARYIYMCNCDPFKPSFLASLFHSLLHFPAFLTTRVVQKFLSFLVMSESTTLQIFHTQKRELHFFSSLYYAWIQKNNMSRSFFLRSKVVPILMLFSLSSNHPDFRFC